ncbi:hypothetical protein PBI_DEWDROP_121 [Microbacterium phage Dewdrop]|nr:hypothetical protein PBI_LEAF_121 [Microbacterium phage Leaf]QGZ17489.1 hypothetical protein PBI_DEWDROP_121 [Microbacterium phage Dewdrop]
MSVKTEYQVQISVEQLMERAQTVRSKVQNAEEHTGEFDLTLILSAWVSERTVGPSSRSERYLCALLVTMLYAPFASDLYHSAGFELLNELTAIEADA